MLKKILVASDSLDACDAPSIVAANLARQEDARLCFLHVLESPGVFEREWVKDFKTGEEIRVTPEYTETVKKTITEKCAGIFSGCKDYVIEARPGFPWTEILREARAMKADLIVLGPHRHGEEEKGVVRSHGPDELGGTVEAVIMRAHCPVMIANRVVPKEKLAFKKILFCTDFSKTCEYAFELSLKLAQKYGSKLSILHVLNIPRGERMSYAPEQIEPEVSKAKEKLEKMYGGQTKGVDHSFTVLEGMPAARIKEYVTSNGIDLIALGSHVKEQEKRWYLGSVVQNLGLEAECPVMTVTRPEALLKFEE